MKGISSKTYKNLTHPTEVLDRILKMEKCFNKLSGHTKTNGISDRKAVYLALKTLRRNKSSKFRQLEQIVLTLNAPG
jgi:hypothetical protein